MGADRWGAAGPPLEAYSRVTNPERFASLHDSAAALLHRLEREFETERREEYGLDPELERDCNLSRPSDLSRRTTPSSQQRRKGKPRSAA